jgi:hypothetical protein
MENSYSILKLIEEIPIDSDLLNSNFKDMVHDITCQICLSIVYPDPVCCKVCEKMYCKKCIDNWIKNSNRCPNNHKYKESQVSRLAKNLLENILFKCRNFNLGCTNQIKYGNYLKHVETECDFIKCKCHGCNLQFTKRNILEHVNKCELFEDKCKYCYSMYKRKDLRSHMIICDMRECKFCKKIFRKDQIENHEIFKCEERMLTCEFCKMKYKRKNEYFHSKELCFKEVVKNMQTENNLIIKDKDAIIAKLELEKKALQDEINSLKN